MTDTERLDWLDHMFRECPNSSLIFNSAEDVDVGKIIGEPILPGFIFETDGCNPVEINSEISLRDAIDLMRHVMENQDDELLET